MSMFKRFCADESGAAAIEYGLLAALLSILLIAGATTSGDQMSTMFNTVGSSISSALSG